jgi:triacylglycerol lipase
MIRELASWALDYRYAAIWQLRSLREQDPAVYSVGLPWRSPVIIIPGVYEPWQFMKPIADALHEAGHPVYFVEELGYHTMSIAESAGAVRRLIDQRRLHKVTIVAHSKGGLVGKFLLVHGNPDHAVSRLIAIATPFSGSVYARWWLLKTVRTFSPRDPVIRSLQTNVKVNSNITSIYGSFDPHIPGGSHLEGANNIKVPSMGHFRILGKTSIKQAVLAQIPGEKTR